MFGGKDTGSSNRPPVAKAILPSKDKINNFNSTNHDLYIEWLIVLITDVPSESHESIVAWNKLRNGDKIDIDLLTTSARRNWLLIDR